MNPSEMLVTSADSRIRIVDGTNMTHKFRGMHLLQSSEPFTSCLHIFWSIMPYMQFDHKQVSEIPAAKLELHLVQMGSMSYAPVKILMYMFGSEKSPEPRGQEKKVSSVQILMNISSVKMSQ